MEGYILSLYPEFACLAGSCPATCCSDWEIMIDAEAHERFQNLENEELRRDIMENIIEEDGQYRFRHQKNGTCALLDEDGLCRIQRGTDEAMLCITCRKFPRIMAEVDDLLWVSFAATCPVVADYILDGRVSWLSLTEDEKMEPVSGAELMAAAGWSGKASAGAATKLEVKPEVEGEAKVEVEAEPEVKPEAKVNFEAETKDEVKPELKVEVRAVTAAERFAYYVDFAMDALTVLTECTEQSYLEKSFDLYEQEEIDEICFERYSRQYRHSWKHFMEQYFLYRYPGRYMEFPQEDLQERLIQLRGELLLIQIMLYSIYCMTGKLERQDWSAVLHWVYRFCVHGKLAAEYNHKNFIKYAAVLESLLLD